MEGGKGNDVNLTLMHEILKTKLNLKNTLHLIPRGQHHTYTHILSLPFPSPSPNLYKANEETDKYI